MTDKEKDLLIKDLCARLPYGVKCAYFDIKGEIKVGELFTVWCNEKRVFIDKLSIDYDGCDCIGVIPYLFPLSSMTDEQKVIYGDLCYSIIQSLAKNMQSELNELINWLNAHHFDYRGLIEKGLAIDATNLNVY